MLYLLGWAPGVFQKNFTIQRVFKTLIPVHRQDIRPVCCCRFFCLFISIFLLFCFSIFIATAVFCRLLHPAPKPQLCFTALKDESNKYLWCHVTPLKNRPGLLQFQCGSWRVFPALLNAWRRTGREPCVCCYAPCFTNQAWQFASTCLTNQSHQLPKKKEIQF